MLLGVTGAIFVLVEGALLLFVIRFRNAGRPREAEGPQIRGHTRLELLWTAIPVVILAGIIAVVFYKLPGIKDIPAATKNGPRSRSMSRAASSTGATSIRTAPSRSTICASRSTLLSSS